MISLKWIISDEVIEQQCISSMDCDEGSICNFDDEAIGFCESCEGLNSDQDCENYFITAEGRRECKSGCVTNLNYTANVLQNLRPPLHTKIQRWNFNWKIISHIQILLRHK